MRSKKRKRQRDREAANLLQVIVAHERAGDVAREHYLYEDAAQHYQDALNVKIIGPTDQLRMAEKLAYALSLGSNPNVADQLFDRVLTSYISDPSKAEKAVELLLQRARQLFLDCKTGAARQLVAQAIQIANANGSHPLRKLTYSRMAGYCVLLSRIKEAGSLLDAVGEIHDTDDISIQATYYTQRAVIAASSGKAKVAISYFEQAMRSAKENTNVYQVAAVWEVYAFWAAALGNMALAKTCGERALLVARQFHILWFLPWAYLSYASLLFKAGQYGAANGYLINALSYDVRAPIIDTVFAGIGMPVALQAQDDSTLSKCVRLSSIERAFQSGEPDRIALVATAFAQWYSINGHAREAKAILHRAVEILDDVDFVDDVWALPVAVARFGLHSDIPRARTFLEARAALPYADVTQACICLFDAFVAKRTKRYLQSYNYANQALERFNALGWYGYGDIARALLPSPQNRPIAIATEKPFADMLPVLTIREQQVAELVLKGFTNREIAMTLSIKERTVEAHMTSIMSHLGIRSRYQLVEHLAEGPR